jgi:hypothetical protein
VVHHICSIFIQWKIFIICTYVHNKTPLMHCHLQTKPDAILCAIYVRGRWRPWFQSCTLKWGVVSCIHTYDMCVLSSKVEIDQHASSVVPSSLHVHIWRHAAIIWITKPTKKSQWNDKIPRSRKLWLILQRVINTSLFIVRSWIDKLSMYRLN